MKKSTLYMLLEIVFLVIFNMVFFFVGKGPHDVSVWISYVFIHLAFVLVIVTAVLFKKSSSVIFGFTMFTASMVYFFAEFIVGVLFILIGSVQIKTVILVQTVILGIYAILLLLKLIINESRKDKAPKAEANAANMIESEVGGYVDSVKELEGKLENEKINASIERLCDLMSVYPSQTVASAKKLDRKIVSRLEKLEESFGEDEKKSSDMLLKLVALTKKRNRLIKKETK